MNDTHPLPPPPQSYWIRIFNFNKIPRWEALLLKQSHTPLQPTC